MTSFVEIAEQHPFRSVFSIAPLLRFWREQLAPKCATMSRQLEEFEAYLETYPELAEPMEDISGLEAHKGFLTGLMSAAFTLSKWTTDLAVVIVPHRMQPVFMTPRFEEILYDEEIGVKGNYVPGREGESISGILRAYFLVLDRFYGIKQGYDHATTSVLKDEETGLDRYWRIHADTSFVDVASVGKPRELSPEERERVRRNLSDLEVLREIIPPRDFELRGFVILRAEEVTDQEVVSALERHLIDQESVFTREGFGRVQTLLQTLLRRPRLTAGMGAIHDQDFLLLNAGCDLDCGCLFSSSRHMDIESIQNRLFRKVIDGHELIRIHDVLEEAEADAEKDALTDLGQRSMILAPLDYQDRTIGVLDLRDPDPDQLGPMEELKVRQILPLFSVALKRGIDELDHNIQGIIKNQCTALHPSVEWRFRRAAYAHLDRLRRGENSEMEPIVFRGVYPLFGQADIRGSSTARNEAIRADLIEHLELARQAMEWASQARPWPFLRELADLVGERLEGISGGVSSGDEVSVVGFLRKEVEPTFDFLRSMGPRVARAVDRYREAVDDSLGTVYRSRREFEDSVSKLNRRLSAYLDREAAAAQEIIPHYFEKHQSDGIDYLGYLGEEMLEGEQPFGGFFVRNLHLWQLMVACGLAWHTERIKAELQTPLEICNLILINNSPLAVRFRYDEKRFDVDGAYDVRHEIIKSRVDKAMIRGGERLTQPGTIAVVLSSPEEAEEMERHIAYLQRRGYLTDRMEQHALEDLPGVRGLTALRAYIDLEAEALEHRAEGTGL